jgi:4-hydroxybenzoate polyprenyltransferase
VITRLRTLILLTRPAVIVLLGLFAATGLAEGGAGNDPAKLLRVLVIVMAFLFFSVVVNDLADEAIDRVNLAGDPSRPLVCGSSTRHELRVIAWTTGAVALIAAALANPPVLVVVIAGLGLSVSYSQRPVRLADRGAVASLVLPAGYVAVPYLVGVLSARGQVTGRDLALLGGLYVGFIGRILLKDFRDVRGDALFGKRTFLVRHGRRQTCAVSAACWVGGTATLAAVRDLDGALLAGHLVCVAFALVLLRALADDRGARRDEALISAIALIGRGMMVLLIGHLTITGAGWSAAAHRGCMLALVAVAVGQAASMAKRGPVARLTIPSGWATGALEPAH